MNPREIMLETLHHRQPPQTPFSLGFEGDVAERLDAHYGTSAWRARLIPYMVQVSAVDTDLKEPVDDIRFRDGYGGVWRHDRRPWHLETPPLAEPTFAGYAFPEPEVFLRPDWREQARRTIADTPDSFHVAMLGWGLFERSWNLRGFENLLTDVVAAPDFFEEALDRLTKLYLTFVEYSAELPVDAIWFGDDWGDQRGVIIGPKRWRKHLKPRWAQIYDAVHRHGMFVIHHSCGSVAEIMPDIIEIGMDVLESVQPEAAGMNPYELKRKWGDKLTFFGGLGSQSIIPFGAPDEIRREVRRLRAEMGRDGGYILSPAKALQPETPTENAVAVFEAFVEEQQSLGQIA
jgi:uroporphyrinogen decarboxylase